MGARCTRPGRLQAAPTPFWNFCKSAPGDTELLRAASWKSITSPRNQANLNSHQTDRETEPRRVKHMITGLINTQVYGGLEQKQRTDLSSKPAGMCFETGSATRLSAKDKYLRCQFFVDYWFTSSQFILENLPKRLGMIQDWTTGSERSLNDSVKGLACICIAASGLETPQNDRWINPILDCSMSLADFRHPAPPSHVVVKSLWSLSPDRVVDNIVLEPLSIKSTPVKDTLTESLLSFIACSSNMRRQAIHWTLFAPIEDIQLQRSMLGAGNTPEC